jgi:hypothetical protein
MGSCSDILAHIALTILRGSEVEGGYSWVCRSHIRSKGGGLEHDILQWEKPIAHHVSFTVVVKVDSTIPPNFLPLWEACIYQASSFFLIIQPGDNTYCVSKNVGTVSKCDVAISQKSKTHICVLLNGSRPLKVVLFLHKIWCVCKRPWNFPNSPTFCYYHVPTEISVLIIWAITRTVFYVTTIVIYITY